MVWAICHYFHLYNSVIEYATSGISLTGNGWDPNAGFEMSLQVTACNDFCECN
jgi:hypothetical protein